MALRELIDVMEEHQINFVVIGGLAAIAWGARRDLADIDIQVGRDDFAKVAEVFVDKIVQAPRHYETEKWDINQMIVRLHGVDVDICQAEDFYVKKDGASHAVANTVGNAPVLKVDDLEISVLPLDDLVAYKRLISRPVDQDDLFLLRPKL